MTVDILFHNASIYNVFIREWQIKDVAVLEKKILFVGDTSPYDLTARQTVECEKRPLIPGLIDIHLHIESTLCTPLHFGTALLEHGVTTIVSEPHEIANVFGCEGVEEMIRASKGSPIDIFYGVPSSVPSTSEDLETTGGIISPSDAAGLFEKYPEILGLGEVMNYAALSQMNDPRSVEMINAIRNRSAQAVIEGHCPSIRDMELAKVLYAGVDSDHCLQDPIGMKQRFENGMFVELQEKSVTPAIVEVLKKRVYEGLYSFVTDDVPPDILLSRGHLDHIVRKAMSLGLPLAQAVVASSWAPARRMGFQDRGAVSPGKNADLILLQDDSSDFVLSRIFRKGKESPQKQPLTAYRFPGSFSKSLNLSREDIRQEMFRITADSDAGSIRLRAMEKNSQNTYTAESEIQLPVENQRVLWEGRNCNLVLVVDRYSGKASFARGILTGCCFKNGAVASSYAHDHHNLLSAGDDPKDMEIAMNWVIEKQGGICLVQDGRIKASFELPIGGILSEEPLSLLAEKLGEISRGMKEMGFVHPNPVMSFCTLTLPVSPALKITDKGLVRTADGMILNLIINK